MKIVEIIPSLYPLGGAERLVCDLASFFVDTDNDVTIVSLYSNKDNVVVNDLKKKKNIHLVFLNKKRGVDFKCAKQLRKVIELLHPDVVHSHLNSLVTIWLSKIYKKYKIIYTFHTLITCSVVGKKTKPMQILYRMLFKKRIIIPVGISEIIKNSICDYYGLSKETVPVINNGVPLCNFINDIHFNDRKYDFIFIGRFTELKNPTTIVHSFIKLYKINSNLKMVMLGEGKLLEKCKLIAAENGCKGIEFVGFTNDVSKYLRNSKFLVLSSSYEGNPITINEAIASKCFVLATNVGGIPDVVNKNNGILVDYSNKILEDLSKKMSWCVYNQNLIAHTLDACYEDNRNGVSIVNCGSKYLKLFGVKNG